MSKKPRKLKEYVPKPRTSQQNRALHKYFKDKADQLNTLGLEMKVVLKPSYEIWWTSESVKSHLWKPLQEAMYSKKSTTQLDKLEEIDHIHETLERILGQRFGPVGYEYAPFPNQGDKPVLKLPTD